ncbi:hypothetical protein JDFnp1_137 [Fusobacterium phage JD-Fnp1]|nr:hypothetical protein JDFnp1_137 [Fusobacterium phage JD-Fnp1]
MVINDKLQNTYDENSFKDRIDMFVRKLSSNSTYTIVESILGFNLGLMRDYSSEYYRKTEKAGYEFYRFRNYGENYKNLSINNYFDDSSVAKYDIANNKIKFNVERQTRIEPGKYTKIKSHDISMMNNFIANSELPYNEYLYKCDLDLSPINNKGMARYHEYLFPVYVDKFKGSDSYEDIASIIRTFGIEVSFGRDKISKLSDFKLNYVFANEDHNDGGDIGLRITAHNNIRGFDFVRWDDISTHKRNRNVLLESGEHTEYSRVRNSRGNHMYKYRITALKDHTTQSTYDTINFGRALSGYFIHADMVYGLQRAMIVPSYSNPDENYRRWLVNMVGGYSMNNLLPNYPTVYVDFCIQRVAFGQKGVEEIFSDNMDMIGFIRVRMYSCNNQEKADLNIGVIQNKYGEGKQNYSTGCTREITNSESFTVKIIIPKRNPLMMYQRNSSNGEQIYMLPPNIFNCQYVYKNSEFPILKNINTRFAYKYMDFNGFYTANYESGVRWQNPEKTNLICAQGGWLFPPLRLAGFSGSMRWNQYNIISMDNDAYIDKYFNCLPSSTEVFTTNLRDVAGFYQVRPT